MARAARRTPRAPGTQPVERAPSPSDPRAAKRTRRATDDPESAATVTVGEGRTAIRRPAPPEARTTKVPDTAREQPAQQPETGVRARRLNG